jgi:hypothetical protein
MSRGETFDFWRFDEWWFVEWDCGREIPLPGMSCVVISVLGSAAEIVIYELRG